MLCIPLGMQTMYELVCTVISTEDLLIYVCIANALGLHSQIIGYANHGLMTAFCLCLSAGPYGVH